MSADLEATAIILVRRALPVLGRGWIDAAGHVSGLLLTIADQETIDRQRGAVEAMPPPLGVRRALLAWGRLQAVIRPVQARNADRFGATMYPALRFVTVAAGDVAVLGAAAARLGRCRGPGGHSGVTRALRRSAAASGRTCEQLVVQMVRVHGVLDLDLGSDGDVLAEWGADGPMFVPPPAVAAAAYRRIASRVYTLWQAGEDRAGGEDASDV